ncbi:hypothetical protein ROZALSC1DRAFT_26633, partial [Rozella allomycis CSF55]
MDVEGIFKRRVSRDVPANTNSNFSDPRVLKIPRSVENRQPKMDYVSVETSFLKRWRQRWLVLDETAICIFENEQDFRLSKSPIRIVLTNGIRKIYASSKDPRMILIETDVEPLKLLFATHDKAQLWKVDICNNSY